MYLDKKDGEILYELDLNSRQSDSEIAKKVRLNKNTVWYRINRLIENKVINNFVTLVNPVKVGLSVFKLYLRLQDVADEPFNDIKGHLLKNKKVFCVSKSEGSWDLTAEISSKTPYDFYEFYSDFSKRYGRQILEKQITSQIEIPFFTRGYLPGKKSELKCIWGGQVSEEKIDDLDLKILEKLHLNSRVPSTELAKTLKTTPRVISYRINELVKRKIVISFSIEINQKAIDYESYKVALSLKNLTKKREHSFFEFCKSQKNVIYCIKTLGPWELELGLEVKNHNELNKSMNLMRLEFGDIIKSYDPLLITEKYKGKHNTLA
jgi:DNA-binding Lrp family transcriptional regulator